MKNVKKISHTPGPWQDVKNLAGKVLVTGDIRPGLQQAVAEIKSKSTHSVADARLIAAAPDLLEQLEFARRIVERTPNCLLLLSSIDAAIAKARGE